MEGKNMVALETITKKQYENMKKFRKKFFYFSFRGKIKAKEEWR